MADAKPDSPDTGPEHAAADGVEKRAETRKTPLFDLHQRLGGKLVDFAGHSLPVQFSTGIIKEHLHTRSAAGLFDVSHMARVVVQWRGRRSGA